MIRPNELLKTANGRTLKVLELIQAGVQGLTAKVQDMDNPSKVEAVKIFHPDQSDADTIARTKYLCAEKLSSLCPCLVAPEEFICDKGRVGYSMKYVPGVPLQEFLETTRLQFVQRLPILVVMADGMARLHGRGIAHGDIRSNNALIALIRMIPQLYWIDADNFSSPHAPKPRCLGDEMYLAPELHRALKTGKRVYPDIGSDKFAFRVMAEEVLMLRHPAACFHEPEEKFEEAMYSRWFYDPALPFPKGAGGYPPRVLNARLADLFRRGRSQDPRIRPDMTEWRDALLDSLGDVYVCEQPNCGGPCLADESKTHCPFCGKPYPAYCLRLPNGSSIPIVTGFMQLGRRELRAGNSVSAVHAILRKIGPALKVECYGMNGTYRKGGGAWIKLEDRKPITLSVGDVLRFADVEVVVEQWKGGR